MTTKTCTKCNETKATTEFYKAKNHKDGLQYNCKCCSRAATAAWAKDNRVAMRDYFSELWSSMTVSQQCAYHSVCNTRRRSDLSSEDLYGGLTFKGACEITVPFVEERLRLEAETGVAHHIDHIIPIAAGGTHTKENLQVLTASENMTKGANE